MADIKRLLNKKGWTGRELGKILLANMACVYKQALEGNYNPTPLVENGQFSKMLSSIKDGVQGKAYNEYYSIHEWLKTRPAISNGYVMNGQNDFARIRNYIMQALFAEDVYRYVEQLPVIMTQKEYDDLKAESVEAYFKDEDGDELQSNVFNLVERAISFYLHRLQTEPQKPNPLKAIRKKYLSQPVKSNLILSRWNEVTESGYYTIEDGSGRRSDEMTDEEWQAAITTPLMETTIAKIKLASGRELKRTLAHDMAIHDAQVLYNGGTEEDAKKTRLEKYYQEGLATPVAWHTYTEPPTDLTKWDIIEQELLLEFYPASLDGEDEYTESNFTASMRDFFTEFKELVTAMLADMDKKYFSGDKLKAADIPLEEWESTLISWRRLYELDFYGERRDVESDVQIFDGNKRALFNGIAILRPSNDSWGSRFIDERGYYIEPDIQGLISSHSLENLFTDSEEYAEHIIEIEDARHGLQANYYYLQGYNRQIDLTIDLTGVEELEVFKVDLQAMEERIKALNELVPLLFKQIQDTDYKDKDLKARKLEVLRDVFPPIEYEKLVTPEENIEQAKELVGSFKAYGERHTLFDTLMCELPEGDGEGAY